MQLFRDVEYTFKVAFGRSKTGKTVTVSILNSNGTVRATGHTIGTVVELGGGEYGVTITFSETFNGYIKYEIGAPDNLETYENILIIDDYRTDITTIRKHTENRWKIESNQLNIYDDDGTTILKTYDLKDAVGAPDGDSPVERDPV